MFTNVLEFLEKSANAFPDRQAIGDEERSFSYSEYVNKAKVIGTFLIRKTECAYNKPVAVLIDRNINSVLAFMGIVYSGNFYVPIDYSVPKERIELILDTLKPIEEIDARPNQDGSYISVEEILNNNVIDDERSYSFN